LNVFPLFVKPDYAEDDKYSKYLEHYLDYLSSDLLKQIPGLDPLYVSSLQVSLRSTLDICRACELGSLDGVVKATRDALNELNDRA
jgi:hypothetical protein